MHTRRAFKSPLSALPFDAVVCIHPKREVEETKTMALQEKSKVAGKRKITSKRGEILFECFGK